MPYTIPYKSGRVAILSDLHIDSYERAGDDFVTAHGLEAVIDASLDALIIAGDLTNGPASQWIRGLNQLTPHIAPDRIYVFPGNHDYYGGTLEDDDLLAQQAQASGVHFVQKSELRHGDTRFLCCTLWTDLELLGNAKQAMDNLKVVRPVQGYQMPIIRLSKGNSREAICTVFEKVNTGGKKLDAFELLTAVFAASEFNLREDWLGLDGEPGRLDRLRGLDKTRDVFAKLASTDFLQACTALSTMDRRNKAAKEGRTGKDLPPVTVRRDAMLNLPIDEYQRLADSVEEGFAQAKKFFTTQRIIWVKDVPYPSQLITLAAVFARLPAKERTAATHDKLDHWYWSCVFGELYAGSVESRIARDIPELLAWIRGEGSQPATIGDAVFQIDRLDTLRTRLAAAYKGVNARLMLSGAQDFITGAPFEIMTYFNDQVDIHHIFPRDWCNKNKIPASRYDSIINKSPLSKISNIRIGGDAPSVYLKRIEDKDGLSAQQLDDILRTHLIDPEPLRADDFEAFWISRQNAIADLISTAMRRDVIRNSPAEQDVQAPYDPSEEDEAAA